MAADELAMQVTRASAAMVLTQFALNIETSTQEEIISNMVISFWTLPTYNMSYGDLTYEKT